MVDRSIAFTVSIPRWRVGLVNLGRRLLHRRLFCAFSLLTQTARAAIFPHPEAMSGSFHLEVMAWRYPTLMAKARRRSGF
jgi:hypothetical protein